MRRIAVVNQKGGVGKTTLTGNLAYALTRLGKRVLLIDMDPQSHLAASLGVVERGLSGMDRVLMHQESLGAHAILVRDNLNLIPAGSQLGQLEEQAGQSTGGSWSGTLLKEALEKSAVESDFVLIDAPPSSGLLVVNILYAADEVLVPVTGDYLGLQGLSYLIGTLKKFEQSLGHQLERKFVMSRFQKRRRLAREVREKVQSYFPGELLKTPIRECDALAEAPGFGKSVIEYRWHAPGARDFKSLAKDLIYERTY
ncbi:MAG: ParA family protein [Gammaproteobacteria bacterium]|jgi:chromosome partitioning protein|nr:ParA family protein [Gammaproteobacteria bacterium]MBT3489875.1 ParA family protein [Gammaproteobacteria bacterium]MBT3719266.1 ParA family protein [Gammaproteobacteria bacterium]MBT3846060.1 ParA family protein [Gammaproteobacteria bacterium]MBT3893520.1 ParA family protein [Gammaproteobacteria bacterium]